MFIEEVKELEGDEYTVVGEYVNTHSPLNIRHNKCNLTFPVLRKNFLKGQRCPECSKKYSKRTRWNTESFNKKVYELVGDEYATRSPYVNSKTHIDFFHLECGKTSPITPGKFLQGNRCRFCYGNRCFNHDWFLQKVNELVGDEYRIHSNYQSMHKPVELEHVTCGTHFFPEPNNFIRLNTRCPKCAGNQKKTTAEFKKEVYNIVGDEYEVHGKYLNSDSPIDMLHRGCGNIYPVTPANFLRGRRCALCVGKAAKTNEMFQLEVFNLVGDEYLILGNYVDSNTHILLQHISCGYSFPVVPYSFLSGSRCPACNENKGQRRIVDYLKFRNFPFQVEYSIPGSLRFDVAVINPKQPKEILAAIEFQGEQHYKPISFFGGRESFRRQIRNDQQKRKYCMQNGIRLIIVPFWQYEQIGEIMDKHL